MKNDRGEGAFLKNVNARPTVYRRKVIQHFGALPAHFETPPQYYIHVQLDGAVHV